MDCCAHPRSGVCPAAQALGEYYMRVKNWAKARSYLQQALAAVPGDSTLRFELSVAEKNLGTFNAAPGRDR